MIIIKGNESRKIEKVWELVKKDHSGNKVAIVGYKGEIPHNFIRAKQMASYENFTENNLLVEMERFLVDVKGRFEALVLYVNCESHVVEKIKELTKDYEEKIFLTVNHPSEEVVVEE